MLVRSGAGARERLERLGQRQAKQLDRDLLHLRALREVEEAFHLVGRAVDTLGACGERLIAFEQGQLELVFGRGAE